jgi:thioredoxin reductase (NADPH)
MPSRVVCPPAGDKKWHNFVDKKSQRGPMRNPLSTQFDVIIIGGGPAGMSASLWCAELGLSSIILEKEPELGGQLLWTFNAINNYLGIKAKNGKELRDRFQDHLGDQSIQYRNGLTIVSVNLNRKRVDLADGTTFVGGAIIIATGVRRRKIDIPGENKFAGSGILLSGVASKKEVKGSVVAIVGGGDAALENALILGDEAHKIYIIHRRTEFSAREDFVGRSSRLPNVEFLLASTVTAILGHDHVEAVELEGPAGRRILAVDYILARIGVVPNSELFADQIQFDEAGYVLHTGYETNIANVFAVGDISNPQSPTISTAVGSAAMAIKTFRNRKIASMKL